MIKLQLYNLSQYLLEDSKDSALDFSSTSLEQHCRKAIQKNTYVETHTFTVKVVM